MWKQHPYLQAPVQQSEYASERWGTAAEKCDEAPILAKWDVFRAVNPTVQGQAILDVDSCGASDGRGCRGSQAGGRRGAAFFPAEVRGFGPWTCCDRRLGRGVVLVLCCPTGDDAAEVLGDDAWGGRGLAARSRRSDRGYRSGWVNLRLVAAFC